MNGLISARARKVVVAELRPERAAILRQRMVARIVSATGRGCATRKRVQVWLVWIDEPRHGISLINIAFSIALVSEA